MRSPVSFPYSVIGVLLIAGLLSGCPKMPGLGGAGSTNAWNGVSPETFARANEARLLGLAYLENSQWPEAAQQFQEVQKLLPNHPLGYLDAAATYCSGTTPKPKEAQEAA